MFSLLTPLVVVTAVVLTSLFTSDTKEIGYGKRTCYLNSTLLVAVAMVTPLLLVILMNVIFFSITVYTIRSVTSLQSKDVSKDRGHLLVYLKLSTVTGAAWLLQILAEVWDNPLVRMAAILFISLQGVFLFMSYICNRQVLAMYLARRHKSKPTSGVLTRTTSGVCTTNSSRLSHSATQDVTNTTAVAMSRL